ncbi:hypothetical protein SOVF_042060 isoform A [Spinacia oleracea]|uniref:Kinesin-like protein KIN-7E isoform X2 n=1 Tax=Spinacia oleracea TaxID=3562 RepID=A0A9R0IIT8_SPIOL|nr:kinesin-like protein KIN-7E isoform X2 [Spinacia oleracea]KNA21547.1 hypothetical protein SOVF_042060 isoform A [Spinacia oleracea]
MGSADGDEAMQGSSGREEERILVSVRLRPLNGKEALRKEAVDWECINGNTIVYKNNLSPERSLYPNYFTFDRVFRSDCTTRQVYEEGAKAVVLSVVSGINSSVFAYGQTSSGKTFTMSGITEYTMEDIFDYIQKHKERDFHLKFSAMEIYNESVRDLLTTDNSLLRLLDDPERGTVVEKLTEETLRDWDHFKELLAMCEAQRQIGETFLNEVSSRSHQILRLTIESSNREFLGKNNCSTLSATLNFVDLAGSERASQALSAGSRLKEGSHINRSLLTLGTVIRKLSKGQTGHIPYRDSKLTRILQSSLGGNARTAVICTLSPARSYVEQSRNTLLFASCAKEVTTDARVNVVMSDKALMKHLQRELARLETELKSANPSTRSDATDLLREKDYKIDELERRVNELTLQLDLAISQIHNLQQEDSSYPNLHVRQASESSCSITTSVVDHHSFSAHSPTFEPPESPDRHSGFSYEENYSNSDIDENLPPSSSFEGFLINTPNEASPDIHMQTPVGLENDSTDLPEAGHFIVSEETEGKTSNSFETDLPNMVEEIGEENTDTFELRLEQVSDGYGSRFPDFVEFDPYQVSEEFGDKTPNSYEFDQYEGITETTSNYDGTVPKQAPEAAREETDNNNLEKYFKEVQCIESENPQDNERKSLVLTGCENDGCTDDKPEEVSELDNMNSSYNQDCVPEIQKLNCIVSSQSNNVNTTCSSSFPEEVKYEIKYESGDGECIDRPEEVDEKLSALNYDADDGIPGNSIRDMELDESSQVADGKVPSQMEDIQNYKSVSFKKEIVKAKSMDQVQLRNFQVEDDALQKANNSIKNLKDVGLNRQDDLHDSVIPCSSDAKRLQREIIGLWDACNILLVHRTYFYLLFIKDDQADTIYMEVERRRLFYIRDAFSCDNSIVLDGRQLTPGSSRQSLHSERKMLSKLMKRRFSTQERIDLYVKWGISLDSKRRSSQLANRLWVNSVDMDHITESAKIVAKLVRLNKPQVPKEVFGLNLTTTQGRRKSFGSKLLSVPCKNTFLEATH